MNTELILFGFGLLLFICVWRGIVRRTALDHFRDQLYDLRDALRCQFLASGHGLTHPLYAELRNLLNQQIRFLDEATFTKVVLHSYAIRHDEAFSKAVTARMEQRFATQDPALKKLVQETRSKAYLSMIGYFTHTTLPLFMIVYAALPCLAVHMLCKNSLRRSQTLLSASRQQVFPSKRFQLPIESGASQASISNLAAA